MDARSDLREFLVSRRGRISPAQAGLPVYGGTNRRVPGLRREEVALIAGISSEYYTRLERGNIGAVSDDVLHGIARALHLDEADRAHLFDLARSLDKGAARRRHRRPQQEHVRPVIQRILDSFVGIPAFIENSRLDLLAVNPLGEAFYAHQHADPIRPINGARFAFLNPNARTFYADWDTVADSIVGLLRTEAGRDPYDRRLTDLVGELCTRSDDFRIRWAAHPVNLHRTGVKRFHHPIVGELVLDFERIELDADPGQRLIIYSAEPASPTHERLQLLASWNTRSPTQATRPTGT